MYMPKKPDPYMILLPLPQWGCAWAQDYFIGSYSSQLYVSCQ